MCNSSCAPESTTSTLNAGWAYVFKNFVTDKLVDITASKSNDDIEKSSYTGLGQFLPLERWFIYLWHQSRADICWVLGDCFCLTNPRFQWVDPVSFLSASECTHTVIFIFVKIKRDNPIVLVSKGFGCVIQCLVLRELVHLILILIHFFFSLRNLPRDPVVQSLVRDPSRRSRNLGRMA